MGIKTNLQILAEITGKILTGGRRTTAVNTRSVLTDLADSSLNKKDGGLVVEALTGYTTDLTPTDDKHFASKKYVDDNSGSVPDATESVKGKVELVSDAELDSATPPDNTATTPTLSPIALSLRGVYLLWKKLYSYFTDRNSSQITVFASNGGSGNTFVANGSPAFSGNLPTKLILTFSQVAGYVPTGASTLNVDGIGAVPLLRQDASNLQNGDIVGGHRYIAIYAPVFGYLLQGVGISGSGTTNLGYTASPTNGVVTSDTGTDATLPLADATNAGLLKPSKYTVLENTSGINTGDETTTTIKTKLGAASTSQDGYLTQADWNTFNNKVSKSGDSMTGTLNEFKGTNISSATTTDIGSATGNYINVTGTTTITALGTAQAGANRIVYFSGVLTITHNSTSLILPAGANITTQAGDIARFTSEGSGNWRLSGYMRADGMPIHRMQSIQLAMGVGFTPVDSTVYYASADPSYGAWNPNAPLAITPVDSTYSKFEIDIVITISGTIGSGENIPVAIRVNNTTDTSLGNVTMNTATGLFKFSGTLASPVTSADYLSLKASFPVMATNPTQTKMSCLLRLFR